jgi:hypothetical protein
MNNDAFLERVANYLDPNPDAMPSGTPAQWPEYKVASAATRKEISTALQPLMKEWKMSKSRKEIEHKMAVTAWEILKVARTKRDIWRDVFDEFS